MTLDGNEIIRRYLDNLAEGFSCHRYDDVSYLVIGTPYLYPNDDGICLYIEELPSGQVRVSDGGETVQLNLWKEGVALFRSPRAIALTREIARANVAEFEVGELTRTGPAAELGDIMLSVIQAAQGVAHLRYTQPRNYAFSSGMRKPRAAPWFRQLETLLAESSLDYTPAAKLTGGSGQVYTVHYQIDGAAYLQALNPGQARRAKAAVDRAFGLWADCNGALTRDRKLTLLNDETLPWKAAHIHRLNQVSTVINWSEREKLPALLAALS